MSIRSVHCIRVLAIFLLTLLPCAFPDAARAQENTRSDARESGAEVFPRFDAEACIRLRCIVDGYRLRFNFGEGTFDRALTARVLGNLTPQFGFGVLADARSGSHALALQSSYTMGDFGAELIYETDPGRLSGSAGWRLPFGLDCRGRVVYGAADGAQEPAVSFEGYALLPLTGLPVFQNAFGGDLSWELFAESGGTLSGQGGALYASFYGSGNSRFLSSFRCGYRTRQADAGNDGAALPAIADAPGTAETCSADPHLTDPHGSETYLEASGQLFPGWLWSYTRKAYRGTGASPDASDGDQRGTESVRRADFQQQTLSVSARLFEDVPFVSRALSLSAHIDHAWASGPDVSMGAGRNETAFSLKCDLAREAKPGGWSEIALWLDASAASSLGGRLALRGRYQYSWLTGANVSLHWDIGFAAADAGARDGEPDAYILPYGTQGARSHGPSRRARSEASEDAERGRSAREYSREYSIEYNLPVSLRRTSWVYRGELACFPDAADIRGAFLSWRHSFEGAVSNSWSCALDLTVSGYGIQEPLTVLSLSLEHSL